MTIQEVEDITFQQVRSQTIDAAERKEAAKIGIFQYLNIDEVQL